MRDPQVFENCEQEQRPSHSTSTAFATVHVNRTGVGVLHVKASADFVVPSSALPMSVDPKVTAQFRNVAGGCWGADYITPLRNDRDRFTAD